MIKRTRIIPGSRWAKAVDLELDFTGDLDLRAELEAKIRVKGGMIEAKRYMRFFEADMRRNFAELFPPPPEPEPMEVER